MGYGISWHIRLLKKLLTETSSEKIQLSESKLWIAAHEEQRCNESKSAIKSKQQLRSVQTTGAGTHMASACAAQNYIKLLEETLQHPLSSPA